MATDNEVPLVQALFSFSGANNDELCFKKGDLIVVTQKEEGGWWEGTFDGNTGWFPSNYVKEYKPTGEGTSSGPPVESPPLSPQQNHHQTAYHSMVSKDIIDSERNFVEDLQNLFSKYLTPLNKLNIISEFEYKQLIGNLEEILEAHYSLLTMLQEQQEKQCKEQRLGGTFLKMAPSLQSAHKTYIANHPKAVCIIEKFKDDLNNFMESHGATRPGTLVLTTALSQPFRRLDKYPGVLQEFHRHIEESHPDRGDTQRSTHVYRELTTACNSIRRQKQLELEVLTNKIYGWDEGESLSILGEILHMRSVALLPDNRDRYLVLFPECLVILALSSRASSFIFEGKYNLADLNVNKLEDGGQLKNSFELSGTLIEPIIAVCQSSADQNYWTEILMKNIQITRLNSTPSHHKCATMLYNSPPAPPAHLTMLPNVCMPIGRPYAILTKHFAYFYRKNIITKQLLRSLNGIMEDNCDISNVVLRRHRSECTLYLNDDETLYDKTIDSWNKNNDFSDSNSLLSLDESINDEFNPYTKQGKHKLCNFERNLGLYNLRKWKYRPNLCKNESVYSTISQTECDSSVNCYTTSSNDSICQQTQEHTSNAQGYYTSSVHIYIGEKEHAKQLQPKSRINAKRKGIALMSEDSLDYTKKNALSPHSMSALTTFICKNLNDKNSTLNCKEIYNISSTNIPARSIVFPSNLYISDDYDSSFTKKICDRTLHGSTDEPELDLLPVQWDEIIKKKDTMLRYKDLKSIKIIPGMAYYMSSCSGDEERCSDDYYEMQRKQAYMTRLLSKSEPDIHYKLNSYSTSKNIAKYSSFYSRILRQIPLFHKDISYGTPSHRSSDSGVADTVNCSDNFVRCRKQITKDFCTKFPIRHSTLLHPTSSECATPEYDSLLHTPSNTISNTSCTSSALVSCISDSSLPFMEAASLDVHSRNETSSLMFKSGLYAHWWLKASISSEMLRENCPSKVIPVRKIADTVEMYSKGMSMKASYHAMKFSNYKCKVSKNSSSNFESVDEISKDNILTVNRNIDPIDKFMCHEPSFESQVSQITVIKKQNETIRRHLKPSHFIRSESSSDIASMHSFYESGEGANVMSFLKDLTEGLPLNFCRKGSSQSDVERPSQALKPSTYPILLPSLSVTDPSNVTQEFTPVSLSRHHHFSSLSLQADELSQVSLSLPRRSSSLPHVGFQNEERILPCYHSDQT